jgi:hypothetical protein
LHYARLSPRRGLRARRGLLMVRSLLGRSFIHNNVSLTSEMRVGTGPPYFVYPWNGDIRRGQARKKWPPQSNECDGQSREETRIAGTQDV